MANLREFLETWSWYCSLSSELRALVLSTASERNAAPGDYIARAGDPVTHWYGLMHGILQMYVVGADGAEATLYCMRAGEWGGEGSLLKKEMRRYDLRALTTARLCLVPARTFETLRNASIEFNHFLCDTMNARMGEFVGMLAASRLGGPEVRLARALAMLCDHRGKDSQELEVPQHALALICGLSRQRVNVAIRALRHCGIVSTEPNKGVLVVQVPRLLRHLQSGN